MCKRTKSVFIKLTILGVCMWGVLSNVCRADDSNRQDTNRPNIVLILCDDLGYADVGFNGSKDISTPKLDQLAKKGTIFSSAYVAHPFCGPSRAAIMTGRYPHTFGSQFNLPERGNGIGVDSGIPVEETFISKMLQESGYHTGLIGKWHLGKTPQFHPNKRGFDDFYGFLGGGHMYFPEVYAAEYQRRKDAGNRNVWSYFCPLEHNGKDVQESEYLTDALSHEGVRFVQDASKKDEPFFLFLSYNAPHTPLEAKDEDLQKFASIPDEKRRTYAAMVHAVDRGVGEVVDALKATGEYENTLIVFLSDNGGRSDQGASNQPLKGTKGDTFEGGYRVPMLFHWPDHVAADSICRHPVSALDFYPTFARLAGATIPSSKRLDGKNIWDDLLAGQNPRDGESVFAMRHRAGDNEVGVRRDDWKLYRSKRLGWQLFNIEHDLGESNDVSAQNPEQVQLMIADVEKWSQSHSQPQWFDSVKVRDDWYKFKMPNFNQTFLASGRMEKSQAAKVAYAKNTLGKDSGGSRGEPIYAENFDKDPGYVSAQGPNANNISSVSFGTKHSKAPHVEFGQFAGTSQYLSDTAILGSVSGGEFAIGSSKRVYEKSRNRSYMTFIDTSSVSRGQYNVSFDVSEFQSSDEHTALYLHVYEGSNSHRGFLDFQVTSQKMLPEFALNTPGIRGQGGKIEQVLLDNEIKSNGRFSLNFGLCESGNEGDFLALVWSQVKRSGNAVMPSMTIDNIVVSKLPVPAIEPSVDLPSQPHGQAGSWKLLEDVSDEFNGSVINTQKWNNNPIKYGAASWDEKNAKQKAGKLQLRLGYEPHTRSNQKLFYKSAMLKSHQQMTYGYYEARIKGCSLFPGACPAFWIFSDGRKYDGEIRYCEIDFVELQMNELNHETGERNDVHHIDMNLHLRLADQDGKLRWERPNTDPEKLANSWVAPWDPRDDFHIYGCDVTPEKITWFIDGQQVASKPNRYWHLPMNIALTLELRHPHIGWEGQNIFPVPQNATEEGFPTTMDVDYVRVWERN